MSLHCVSVRNALEEEKKISARVLTPMGNMQLHLLLSTLSAMDGSHF